MSDQLNDVDPIFEQEQQHLSEVYATLQEMAQHLLAKIDRISAEAAEDKESMTSDLKRNFASLGEAQEMHVDFAIVNAIIEGYNLSHDLSTEKLSAIGTLLRQPYFAKVGLQMRPGEPVKELYIGNAGISDENYRRLVVDWRSPVAEAYYNHDMGPTSYRANGREIKVDVKLRRQFDIFEDQLKAYFDSDVAIQDSLLLASLNKQRTAQMQAITATIQREQNVVVRYDDVPVLLVSGIAGSGKTSVLMQRIAFLFFRNRETLDPSQVVLLTPNPVFGHYIANVLPDLGERNPEIQTWADFMGALLPENHGLGRADAPLESLRRIDAATEDLQFHPDDYRDLVCQGETLISAHAIRQIAARFKHIPAGPHLVTLVREELEERLESRLKQLASMESMQDEVANLPLNEQIRLFASPFDPQDENEARQLTLQWVRERFADAPAMVANDEWLNIDRIALRLLGSSGLSSVEWVYLKMICTGMGNPDTQYVMIDEVQDYTSAQLAFLARYFRNAHFMLLGDPHQAIADHTANFDEIEEVFVRARGTVDRASLMTSYRSTPEITALFAKLLPHEEHLQVSSIQRDDEKPRLMAFASQAEWERELRETIAAAQSDEGTTAVVAADKQQLKWLQRVLGEDAPLVVRDDTQLPDHGVVLITLRMAKGLEFDHVVIPDAQERIFSDDELHRNRLYTTISRATHRITVLSNGEMTPLLVAE